MGVKYIFFVTKIQYNHVKIMSSTESKIGKPLLTNSAKEGERIVKCPRHSILKVIKFICCSNKERD